MHTPRFAGSVDDPVFSDLDECTRETADTCIQKEPRIPCRDRARSRVRMKEREARGVSLFFRLSRDGRISHVKTAPPTAQDDRSRMNVRPWFGSAVWLAPPIPSYAEVASSRSNYWPRRPDYPGSFADTQMDGMTASGAKRPLVFSPINSTPAAIQESAWLTTRWQVGTQERLHRPRSSTIRSAFVSLAERSATVARSVQARCGSNRSNVL